ncbi:fatty acid hydroxylase domain-containing protein 2-like [Culicoides brevitarsis]|uniref:fatty acid hydroxylase domain-containing protein 2-like n=1 Tax=Culicoides brevitarsis TaxID=469753 RepID=UPI00307C08C4
MSHLVLQKSWNKFLDRTTQNPVFWYFFVAPTVQILTYWFIGGIYLFFDLTKKPKILQKYKIYDKRETKLTFQTFKLMSKRVLFNQFIVQFPLGFILCPLIPYKDMIFGLHHIPSVKEFIVQFLICYILREILFYYIHRLLHHRYFYENFHKQHHQFLADTAISAINCSAIDHLCTNSIPIVAGPALMKSSFVLTTFWFVFITFSALQDHSGYEFPWYFSLRRHYGHHKSFNKNYGIIGLMDWIHGTSL